jgi:hypothetical protein
MKADVVQAIENLAGKDVFPSGVRVFRIQKMLQSLPRMTIVTLGNRIRFDFDFQKKVPSNLEAFAKAAEELLSKN